MTYSVSIWKWPDNFSFKHHATSAAICASKLAGLGFCFPPNLMYLNHSLPCLEWVSEWVKVAQLCPTLCIPMDCSPAGSIFHGVLQARILEWVVIPFSRRSFPHRDWSQVSRIGSEFLTISTTREAQEYWSSSLSLLQGIFPIQESNQGLLHCRQILYQLSYQGSPIIVNFTPFIH